ncbi:TPA: restriction endonuclease subunit S [Enterococcus faecalis]|uniref:restriction endonuclease subunit S n=1 Tax=Enterococcus faecalis TaxID=1351 RepID=UPI002224E815|nr:restriction endonuclease subunit S [Enterococcus faecalis]UYY33018.1 restriction endonuclease subunit S [Enterococcus faecalis]HCR3430082.1 restriction endonuclease subunit S [Enterococcus faecalis]
MKKEQKNSPNLRFKGFTEDWELCKLGDITESFSGGTPQAGNSDYYDGEIPFIRSGEINDSQTELFITEKGLNNSSAKIVEKGDILYALYGATSGEVGISQINGAINQAILAIRPIKEDEPYLIAQWLLKQKESIIRTYLQGGQGNLSSSIVKELVLKLPKDKAEQAKIGTFFKQLDDTITLHQRKLEQLKELKTAYLQVMFVSMKTKNNKVPKLRFADFGGEWDQRKSKELFIPKSEKNQPNLPVLSVTQDSGVVYRDQVGIDIKYDSTTLKNYKVVNKNDFVISLRSFQGGFELSDKKGITSPAYTIFVPKDIKLHDNLFWKTQFKTFQFIEALKTVTFGIRDGKSISFTEFGDLKLCFPKNKKEQQKIGKFFEELDYAISLHQNKLTQLKSLKKSYLQNMFI